MRQGFVFSIIVLAVFCAPVLGYSWPGNGSPENPYQIRTVNDWMGLIGASYSDLNKHFILTADIDFQGTAIKPVARDTDLSRGGFQGTSFTGRLDGGGHVLRNVVINQPTSYYVGLFGQVGSGGQIRNLSVESLQVTGRYFVGGLCGYNYGMITSCYAMGTVSGSYYVGGLCGWNDYGTIISSYATGIVSGYSSSAGGLCGYNAYGAIKSCYATGGVSGASFVGSLCGYNAYGTITSCYATGVVSGTAYVGGLCGRNYYGTITSCYATGAVSGTASSMGGLCGYSSGTISISYATGTVSGDTKVGGLCGYNDSGTITSCYAAGAVNGDTSVGGLCGRNDSGMITSCYALGTVSGDTSVGGLCGRNRYSSSITSCYAKGAVSGDTKVGGLCGQNSGTISASFWDIQTSGMTTSAGGTGKTSAEMKDMNTFIEANWDFAVTDNTPAAWYMPEGDYPGLTCQLSVEVGDVTGLHLTEIVAQLMQVWPGLKVILSAEASDTIAEGHVIRQIPPPGSSLPGNSSVFIVIACKPSGYRGSGTAVDPFQIDTPSDWLWFVQRPSDWSKQFILTADLDFGGVMIPSVAPDTIPSSSGFNGTSFAGMLDGGGHVLRNFVIHQPDSYNVGLFGQVASGGRIWNLGVEPLQVTGRRYIGGLCGRNSGMISTSYATGAVSGISDVGGLCGYNSGGTITNSYAACSIGGNDFFLGGLVGTNYSGGIIEKCYTAGTNTDGYVEAVCGANYSGSTISNCYFYLFSGMDRGYGTVIETANAEADLFVGFDFAGSSDDGNDDYWTIVSGHCPKFTWQSDDGPLPPPSPMTTLSGSGYPDSPFQINDISDFMEFATNSNLTLGYYTLTTDIDLSDNVFANAPVNHNFNGHFAGNGHVVSNLTIDTQGNGNDYLGLFQTISTKSADVSDLGIIDCNIMGDDGSGNVGGLCGGNSGNIRNCYSTGNVSGGWRVGGLMGYNYQNVRDCFSMTKVSGTDSFGGFCGSNSGPIEDCYATGTVFGGEDASWFGGFCGVNFNSISRCYSTGIVEGGDGSSSIGGFLGLITGSGSPPGPDLLDTQADYLGEPMRESEEYRRGVYHCYFLESAGPHNAYGTPLTGAQMKQQASYTTWDFIKPIWVIDEGVEHPYLWWEIVAGPSDLLVDLGENINGLDLPAGTANSLQVKLDGALKALEDGNENNDGAAVNSLEAFINAVNAQRGKKISEDDADYLIVIAQQIIEMLSGQ